MNTTSWLGMFDNGTADSTSALLAVTAIEIPILQRDYAQGRSIDKITRIRKDFLDVLYDALTNGTAVTLDFVYGDIVHGKLTPLDGQQRLTTLFLLHWYIAACEQVTNRGEERLTRFSYETRPSARDFCWQLARARPPLPLANVREWLEDQSWFAHSWHLDATVQAMLVMLDAIQVRFGECGDLWRQLANPDCPAISFHFLPLADMGLSDDLYIKMNSRGKPLTAFENFKARFEQLLQASDPGVHKEFTQKIDGNWTDMLWRGGDSSVDDAFLRYFRFVSHVLVMRSSAPDAVALDPPTDDYGLAVRVYGHENPDAAEHRRYLIDALDVWCVVDPAVGHVANKHIAQFFEKLCCSAAGDVDRVRMFDLHTNPLQACFDSYGTSSFTGGDGLVLAGIVEYLIGRLQAGAIATQGLGDLRLRLRRLRNLVINSSDELRPHNMPDLHREVARLAQTGLLDGAVTFNKNQIAQEKDKRRWRMAHPAQTALLHAVDDHYLLRGNLAVLDLTASEFSQRATVFLGVFSDSKPDWMAFGAALLACGDYHQVGKYGARQLGSPKSAAVWRALLTGSVKSGFARTAKAVRRLLDTVSAAPEAPVPRQLKAIADRYVADCVHAAQFDWRYYFIKYDVMRTGASGLYYWTNDFDLRMMTKERINSWHHDPYLSAVLAVRQSSGRIEDRFIGSVPCWLSLPVCGLEICSDHDTFLLRDGPGRTGIYDLSHVLAAHDVAVTEFGPAGPSGTLTVAGTTRDGRRCDEEDRVQKCARLIDALIGLSL